MRMKFFPVLTALALALAGAAAGALPAQAANAPEPRPKTETEMAMENQAFTTWLQGFAARARAKGITNATLSNALDGLQLNQKIIDRDRNQAEFTKPIWEYLDSAASQNRITTGREMARKHRGILDQIEAQYGVDREYVLAIWGLESNFGSHRGKTPIIEALATLAYDARRGAFFEAQLIDALKIIQAGDIDPAHMLGSWAGAMGHTQFIPSSYLEYAQDFTGDGRRDIWADDPSDALASTANYLAKHGWKKGHPWGIEVRLPDGFDYALAQRRIKRLPSTWAADGVRAARAIPDLYGPAAILLPAGASGPALMVFHNFKVIERYNAADAYVIGVGILGDQIAGGSNLTARWPRHERPLSRDQIKEMQRLLTANGFNTAGIDGRAGPKTGAALRAYQASIGITPDGFATRSVLSRLRQSGSSR